jgi:hypothetical protein
VPAFVQSGRLDVLAANPLARALYLYLFTGAVPDDDDYPPNHARFTFLDPRAADFYPDSNLRPLGYETPRSRLTARQASFTWLETGRRGTRRCTQSHHSRHLSRAPVRAHPSQSTAPVRGIRWRLWRFRTILRGL